MTRAISLAVLLIMIVLLGGMMYHVIAPFILPLFLAAVLTVICQPLHKYFLQKTGERKAWAAAFSTSALVAIVVIPVTLGTFVAGVNLYAYVNQKFDGDWQIAVKKIKPLIPRGPWDRHIDGFERQLRKSLRSFAREIVTPRIAGPDIKSGTDQHLTENDEETSNPEAALQESESGGGNDVSIEKPSIESRDDTSTESQRTKPSASVPDEPTRTENETPAGAIPEEETEDKSLQSLIGQIAGPTLQVATSVAGIFVSLSIAAGTFITALYYFLADGPDLIAAAEKMIPLPVDHQRRLCERFSTVVRAVVTATFLAALAQGFATAVALWFCGYEQFLILLAIATVASLIPLIGAWIVWVPCAVWLAVNDQWTAAILLTLWGAFIVSMLDNVVKMYVLQNDADLHPLLAFISVVGALQVLGVWGIFIGPIVASCLFALIQIFNSELLELSRGTKQGVSPPEEATINQETTPKAHQIVAEVASSVDATSASASRPGPSQRTRMKSKRKRS